MGLSCALWDVKQHPQILLISANSAFPSVVTNKIKSRHYQMSLRKNVVRSWEPLSCICLPLQFQCSVTFASSELWESMVSNCLDTLDTKQKADGRGDSNLPLVLLALDFPTRKFLLKQIFGFIYLLKHPLVNQDWHTETDDPAGEEKIHNSIFITDNKN